MILKNLELTKKCKICNSEFEPKKEGQTCCSKKCYSRKWRVENLEHRKSYKKEYYHNGNQEYKEYCDKKTSLWMYKMSVAEFDVMLGKQNGHCALCNNKHCTNGYRLHVDHDHKCCNTRSRQATCGKCTRGLLCGVCNRRLGFLEKNIIEAKVMEAQEGTWLFKALLYISQYEVKI
jgi:Recombination endonuclease VII